jgi:formate dehydrogenase maturation protein FdhE
MEDNPIYAEVMAVHDSIMPKMSDIHSLKKELNQHAESGSRDQVLSAINGLDKADEAMMDWMANFNVPEDKSEVDSYLNAQKTEINLVAEQMLQAIQRATMLKDSLK